jgi:hypothetical protein
VVVDQQLLVTASTAALKTDLSNDLEIDSRSQTDELI